MVKIWDTKEKIIEEAKKYHTLKDFRGKSNGAFKAARRFGIIDELDWLEKEKRQPFGYWKVKEHCIEEAKKYKTRNEFRKGNQSAYWASLKYGYLEEMPWLAKRKSAKRGTLNNKDFVINEGKKYKTRSEFREKNRSVYQAAIRYGWLDEMDWLGGNNAKPHGFWNNKDVTFEEAGKYASRTEFMNGSNGAYNAAKKNGWLDEMDWLKSKNIKGSTHKKRRWKTKDDVIEESKKYNNRTDFNRKSRKAYDIARKNKWLDEMVWLNGKNVYLDKLDIVYKYYFVNENAIYVGRTIYKGLRDRQHRTVGNDSVYRFAKEHNIEIPEMQIIESNLTVLEGAKREIYWEEYYRNNGYKIINKQPCGSIGSMAKGKWSKRKCIEESKKYKSRTEFFNNSNSAYQKSLKEGWLDEMTWLSNSRKYPRGYWTIKENVLNEAKKYKTKKEFEKNNISAYLAAYKYGFIKDIDWFITQNQRPFGFWKNKENVIEESKKYGTITDFRKNSPCAYKSAKNQEMLNEMTWLKKDKKKMLKQR